MLSSSLEEEHITEYVRNLFRMEKLKKEKIDTTIQDIKNLFILENESKAIKDFEILETFLEY